MHNSHAVKYMLRHGSLRGFPSLPLEPKGRHWVNWGAVQNAVKIVQSKVRSHSAASLNCPGIAVVYRSLTNSFD